MPTLLAHALRALCLAALLPPLGGQAQTAPPPPPEEGMPPAYRKISLNGRPLDDPLPQDAPRTDDEPEQTYIDALTLRLTHRTTDIYVPILLNGFALAVNRNVEDAAWAPGRDLAPAQRPDLPFGGCWSSGLAASVHLVEGKGGAVLRATVTDEQGTIHPFAAAPAAKAEARRYVPLLTSRSDQDALRAVLAPNPSGALVFRRKFGMTLTFGKEPVVVLTAGNGERHSFYRLDSFADRFGTRVTYVFRPANHGLAPDEVAYRDTRIRVEFNKTGQVERLVDPAGGDILYDYRPPVQADGAPLLIAMRRQVMGDLRGKTQYEYDEAIETRAGAPAARHCNLARISDPLDNTYELQYAFDPASPAPGSLRKISAVTLPKGKGVVRFRRDPGAGASGRATFTVDAEGNGRAYEFTGRRVETPTDGKIPLARVAVHTVETVSSFAGGELQFAGAEPRVVPTGKTSLLDRESYEFDPEAGMAVAKATDNQGNGVSFAHGDPSEGQRAGLIDPLATRCADPTAFTDALGAVTASVYEPAFRLLTQTTDPLGRIACRLLDGPTARLASERVYADAAAQKRDQPFTRTDYEHARADLPGFVTRKTIRKTGASPEKLAWEQDLVTEYECDNFATVTRETADPAGDKETKSYTFDENLDKRSVTFASGYRIDFAYDAVNHLTRVFRPGPDGARTTKALTYDLRGNKIKEVDPDGAVRTFAYDGDELLGQSDFPPGAPPDKPAHTVEYRFNRAGSKIKGVDDQGRILRFKYDGMQRVNQITYDDGSEVRFGYASNCGDGLFKSSAFHVTSSLAPAAGVRSAVTYDAAGRRVAVERWASGAAVPQRTEYQYDAANNLIAELEPGGRRVTHAYDALNRLIATGFPGGKSEQTLYSSTGLKYATVDASGKRVERQFDATGEAIPAKGK